jgi:hypothetical protein
MENIISILFSVLIPGIILAVIQRNINKDGVKLNYYISNASQFNVPFTDEQGNQKFNNFYIHTLTLRNNGNVTANNVDVSHFIWPLYHQVSPFLPNEIIADPATKFNKIIRFQNLGPGESVSISYIYTSPLLPHQCIEYVRSSEGLASLMPVMLNRVFPNWFNRVVLVLCFIGLICIGLIVWKAMPIVIYGIKWAINFKG